jgi:hypothetical protein
MALVAFGGMTHAIRTARWFVWTRPPRFDYEYERNGTANLSMANS